MADELKLSLVIDDDGTLRVIDQVGDRADRTFDRAGSGAKRLSTGLGGLKTLVVSVGAAFATWQIGKIADQFLEAAKEAEGFKVRLNALLGSTAEGGRLFKEMADFAAAVPFEYKEIMASATALSGVMRGGVDEIKQWMPLIADLAAASGLSIQETTGQVTRMYSAGAASADMFRERGILAMLGFQAGVSYSAEETRRIMFESWNAADSQFKGITAELAKTWSGTMSMFSDQWFQFQNMVMDSGVFEALKGVAQELLASVQRLKDEGKLEEYAQQVGEIAVGVIANIVRAIGAMPMAFAGLKKTIGQVGTYLIALYDTAMTISTLGVWKLDPASKDVEAAALYFAEMAVNADRFADSVAPIVNEIMALGDRIANLKPVFKETGEAAAQAAQAVANDWVGSADEIVDAETTAAAQIAEGIYDLVGIEEDAAARRLRIVEDYAGMRADAEYDAAQRTGSYASVGQYTGLPVGPSSTVYEYHGASYYSYSALQRAMGDYAQVIADRVSEQQRIDAEIQRAEEERARSAQRIAEQYAREAERLIQEQTRFAGGLLGAADTIDDFISGLGISGASPSMAMGAYGARYQELLSGAYADQEGVGPFLQYIEEYLGAQRAYGGQDYQNVYGSVVGDIRGLQEMYDLFGSLADLGIGDNVTEISALVDALDLLGVSSTELADAVEATRSSSYSLVQGLMDTGTPFVNVVQALSDMGATTEDQLSAVAGMFEALAAGIGQGAVSIAGGIQAAYNQAQQNPTITYQPVVIDHDWVYKFSHNVLGVPVYGWYNPYAAYGSTWSYSQNAPDPVQEVIYGPGGREGGIFSGPDSGHLELLHGTEAVIPLKNGRVPVELNGDASGGGEIHVHLYLDGKEILRSMVGQAGRNPAMARALSEAIR